MLRRIPPWMMPALLALVAAGCGSSDTVLVTGKLMRSSRPFGPEPTQMLAMTFLPVDKSPGSSPGAGSIYPARVSPDGSFEVPGPDGRGIPKGKYRVSLLLRKKPDPNKKNLPSRPRGPVENREKDWLLGQFNAKTSPIFQDVENAQELVIDLDRFPATPGQGQPTRVATAGAEIEG